MHVLLSVNRLRTSYADLNAICTSTYAVCTIVMWLFHKHGGMKNTFSKLSHVFISPNFPLNLFLHAFTTCLQCLYRPLFSLLVKWKIIFDESSWMGVWHSFIQLNAIWGGSSWTATVAERRKSWQQGVNFCDPLWKGFNPFFFLCWGEPLD